MMRSIQSVRFSLLATTILFLLTNGLSSCKAVRELQALFNCEFKMKDFAGLNLAGIPLDGSKGISDFGLMDAAKLKTAYDRNELAINWTLNVDVRNPNNSNAAVNSVDWIFLIDNIEVMRGALNQRFAVAGNGGTATMPLNLSVNLNKIFTGKSMKWMFDLAGDMSQESINSKRIQLKIRPAINIGGAQVKLPGYMTVGTTYKKAQSYSSTAP